MAKAGNRRAEGKAVELSGQRVLIRRNGVLELIGRLRSLVGHVVLDVTDLAAELGELGLGLGTGIEELDVTIIGAGSTVRVKQLGGGHVAVAERPLGLELGSGKGSRKRLGDLGSHLTPDLVQGIKVGGIEQAVGHVELAIVDDGLLIGCRRGRKGKQRHSRHHHQDHQKQGKYALFHGHSPRNMISKYKTKKTVKITENILS